MLKLVANFIAFQAGWFACVLSMANGTPLIGVAIVALVVAGHVLTARSRTRELVVLLSIGSVGATVDTALASTGWVTLSHSADSLAFVFLWFAAFWANFATTLTRCMRWLRAKPVLAVLFGAVGGPPAYLGAEALGALELPGSLATTILVYGGYWAVAMPVVLWAAHRFNHGPRAPRAELASYRSGAGA